MRLSWQPEGAEPREFEFTPRRLRTVEVEDIEAVGGVMWEDFDRFRELLGRGNRRALRAALWVLRRRDEKDLRFDQLDLSAGEVKLDYWGTDERADLREQVLSGALSAPDVIEWAISVLGEDPRSGDPKAQLSGSPEPGSGQQASGAATGGPSPVS